jgi:antitoxin component of MazEF toxin-antitoxin module
VDLGVQKGRLIITPVRAKDSLKDLLAKVTRLNIHNEEDFGASQGSEIL